MKLVSFVVAPSAIIINFYVNGATIVAPFFIFPQIIDIEGLSDV